ncbi:MAG: SEL1-like repeat protein [Lachnospiraceae bacterium]|nr:SEL1-like repeat protein [Lachnospiraceae bacterium]
MPLPFLLGLGALAAGAIGAGGHLSASVTNEEAERVSNAAQELYEKEKKKLDKAQNKTKNKLKQLANSKTKVMSSSMKQFVDAYDKVKHIQINSTGGMSEISKFSVDKQDMLEIREMTDLNSSVFDGGVKLAAGAALSWAIGAPLAAVAAPVLFFSGLSASFKADENLEKAKTMMAEAEAAVEKMKVSETMCKAITERADMFNDLLTELNGMFGECAYLLEKVIAEKEAEAAGRKLTSQDFSEEDMKLLAMARALAGAVKAVIDTPILTKKGDLDMAGAEVYGQTIDLLPDFSAQTEEVYADAKEVYDIEYEITESEQRKINEATRRNKTAIAKFKSSEKEREKELEEWRRRKEAEERKNAEKEYFQRLTETMPHMDLAELRDTIIELENGYYSKTRKFQKKIILEIRDRIACNMVSDAEEIEDRIAYLREIKGIVNGAENNAILDECIEKVMKSQKVSGQKRAGEKKVTAENIDEIIRLAKTDAEAQNLLCEAYWYGDVVEKDLKKSFFYAEKAAAQNNTQAMINLSFYLRKGIECKRDFERAEDLVLRAAQMGDSDAYGDLAEMYLFGMGPIEQNLDEAFYYMDKMVEADAKDKEEVLGWFGLSEEQFAMFYAKYLDGEIEEDRIRLMEDELKKGQPEEYLPYQTKEYAEEAYEDDEYEEEDGYDEYDDDEEDYEEEEEKDEEVSYEELLNGPLEIRSIDELLEMEEIAKSLGKEAEEQYCPRINREILKRDKKVLDEVLKGYEKLSLEELDRLILEIEEVPTCRASKATHIKKINSMKSKKEKELSAQEEEKQARERQALEKERQKQEKEIQALKKVEQEREKERQALEKAKQEREKERQALERERLALEKERQEQERERQALEQERQALEKLKQEQEKERLAQEKARLAQEKERLEQERERLAKEKEQQEEEEKRQSIMNLMTAAAFGPLCAATSEKVKRPVSPVVRETTEKEVAEKNVSKGIGGTYEIRVRFLKRMDNLKYADAPVVKTYVKSLQRRIHHNFIAPYDEQFDKKVGKAMKAYAKEVDSAKVILMRDVTLLGSGKEGFLMTTRGFYGKNTLEKPYYCDYKWIRMLEIVPSTASGLYNLYAVTDAGRQELGYSSHLDDLEREMLLLADLICYIFGMSSGDYAVDDRIGGERSVPKEQPAPQPQTPANDVATAQPAVQKTEVNMPKTGETATVTGATPEKTTKFCGYCGKKISINAKFCGYCGKASAKKNL